MRLTVRSRLAALLLISFIIGGCAEPKPTLQTDQKRGTDPKLKSLDTLAIETLRNRAYGTSIEVIEALKPAQFMESRSLLASYDSDGLRVYTRIDLPRSPPPRSGYPVLIFVHGWYGRDAAPGFDFFQAADSQYARLIRHYTDRGFLVLSPALRGHGTVDGIPADGIEFLEAWDNASYLSPVFYAIDVLNLLDGLDTLERLDHERWGATGPVRVNFSQVSVSGHSQGADAVLTALAVAGEGSSVSTRINAGSLWSGCFGTRFEQAAVYGPMSNTLQAFMAGDGHWNGTAVGRDGSVNPDFVFGYPPDWIATVDTQSLHWTWQAETWSVPSVAESLDLKFGEMYRVLETNVDKLDSLVYRLSRDEAGRTVILHDPTVDRVMRRIDAVRHTQFLTEPLHLHHSDQDYYSIPRWNRALAADVRATGGDARAFAYPQNTHALTVSSYDWFSSGEVVSGFEYMLQRDASLFTNGRTADPTREKRASPTALKRYADTVSNEFFTAFEREPLEGLPRRVVRFSADGLEQYALVVEPAGEVPDRGWPVLLMSHGYHPEPRKNGRTRDGRSDRPGDYYRGLPAAYARLGFLVVWPDFRGHNVSEGFAYTQSEDPPAWYARDLVAAFRAIPSLAHADDANLFLWGHSMGGNVTLQALSALDGEVRAASVWSTWLGAGPVSDGDLHVPLELATPLIVQHGERDATVAPDWSMAAGKALETAGRDAKWILHPDSGHLFEDAARRRAIEEDVRFFRERLGH